MVFLYIPFFSSLSNKANNMGAGKHMISLRNDNHIVLNMTLNRYEFEKSRLKCSSPTHGLVKMPANPSPNLYSLNAIIIPDIGM
jgi:hypothetical protein